MDDDAWIDDAWIDEVLESSSHRSHHAHDAITSTQAKHTYTVGSQI